MLLKYGPLLKEQVLRLKQRAKTVKVLASCLLPATQKEFVGALARHIQQSLAKDIKSAQCYGIMFDRTPNLSYSDQLSLVIRYVKIGSGKVEVKEVFLGPFPLSDKKIADLANEILQSLEHDGLDIVMC